MEGMVLGHVPSGLTTHGAQPRCVSSFFFFTFWLVFCLRLHQYLVSPLFFLFFFLSISSMAWDMMEAAIG